MRTTGKLAAVVTLGAAAFLGLSAAPAQAADGWDRCPPGHFCLFEHSNGQGKYVALKCAAKDLGDIGGGLDNMASSAWNRTDVYWRVFDAYDYNTNAPNSRFSPWAMGNVPLVMNDKISSVKKPFCG